MALAAAADIERPSLVRVGASSEPWSVEGASACGFTERTSGVIQKAVSTSSSTASHVGVTAPPSSCLMSRGGGISSSVPCGTRPTARSGVVAVAWVFERRSGAAPGKARGSRQGSVEDDHTENECSHPDSNVRVSIDNPSTSRPMFEATALWARAAMHACFSTITVAMNFRHLRRATSPQHHTGVMPRGVRPSSRPRAR